jgi:Icc-related predicted phosphoesterase
MKILYISDTHTTNATLQAALQEVLAREDYDIVLGGGDWDVVPFSPQELHRLTQGKPILSVYGNHDDPNVLKFYKILLEDGTVFQAKKGDETLNVCGFGGALIRDPYTYPETWHEPEYYLTKYLELRETLREKYGPCHILVTHDSPQAIVNAEQVTTSQAEKLGIDYKAYRIALDLITILLQPILHLCGHVHSTPFTFTTIKNIEVYSSTGHEEIPVLKTIFLYGAYAIIDTLQRTIEVKKWDNFKTAFKTHF